MKLIDLKQSELKLINGGGIAYTIGRAWGKLCCTIGCAVDAFYDYFDGVPAGMHNCC